MKTLLAVLTPAPLLAAITPTEIAAAVAACCVIGWAMNELFAEHFRKRKIERDVKRFFERRARNARSIRL
jgi:hypothetical protein